MDKKESEVNSHELLFDKLVTKVKNGGEACELAEAIKEYEFSVARTQPISLKYLAIYYSSLLLSHNFIELRFAVERHKQLYSDAEVELYSAIALEAKKSNYKKMLEKTAELTGVSQSELKNLFTKAIKSFIIKSLAKNFTNMQISYLEKNYGFDKKDLESNGCTIDGKYAVFPVETKINRLDELMEDRIRQVATITENVVRS